MKINVAIIAAMNWPCDNLDRLRDWLEAGDREFRANQKTVEPNQKTVEPNPLAQRCYLMSESHLGGHRLIIGFETLEDAQDAHEYVARLDKTPNVRAKPPEGSA